MAAFSLWFGFEPLLLWRPVSFKEIAALAFGDTSFYHMIMNRWGFLLVFMAGIFAGSAHATFLDVDTTHPNFYAIDSLQSDEIIEGYPYEDGYVFKPLQYVNRAEALKVLLLAADFPIEDGITTPFSDVPNSAWFAPYVGTGVDFGIIQGFRDGGFHPSALVTKAEFAKMIAVAFDMPTELKSDDQEWYVPFLTIAQEYRILDDGERPHQELTRGEVAEMIYRAQIVAQNEFEAPYVFTGFGAISYYAEDFHGKTTASGEVFDQNALTAAHRTLPFGTKLRVTVGDKSVIVTVNDRGPYHQKRVLDLSKGAFERVASLSSGVTWGTFQVVALPGESVQAIPEYVRPELEDETRTAEIPEVVEEELTEVYGTELEYEIAASTPSFADNLPTKPYFDETIAYVSEDFFDGVRLRKPFPQKVYEGTVLSFSGTAENLGHSKAMVFLEPRDFFGNRGEQIHFTGEVSGTNFHFPVLFLEPGTYQMGFVFDNETMSRVTEIEVVKRERDRYYSASGASFSSDLSVRVVPEDKQVVLSWDTSNNVLTRLTFAQGAESYVLDIESGVREIVLEYDFFEDFLSGKTLTITGEQAYSRDTTLANQVTNWKEVFTEEFLLWEGFTDEESDDIAVSDFERFVHDIKPVTLHGRVIRDFSLRDTAYVMTPNGLVDTVNLTRDGSDFSLTFVPENNGRFIVEIVAEDGTILFNRAVYVSSDWVLPVKPLSVGSLTTRSVPGVRNWMNRLRSGLSLSALSADTELNQFAQGYAEQMAQEGFVGHTSPTGRTFEQRVKSAGLIGKYAENIGYATTLDLALEGLEYSGSHRRNMLSDTWGRVGVGIAQNGAGEYYTVHVFGD